MSEPSEPKWDWRGKYLLPVATAFTVLLLGSLAFYLTGGWENIFGFLGKPVTVPLVGFLFLLLGWLILVAVAAVGGVVAVVVLRKETPKPKKREPLIEDGVKWRWQPQMKGGIRVVPFCAACDWEFIPVELQSEYRAAESDGFVLFCPTCDKEIARYEDTLEMVYDHVGRRIQQRQRKEEENES
jgi:hypothetical protein